MHIGNQIKRITQQVLDACPPELFLEACCQDELHRERETLYREGKQALAQVLDGGQAERLEEAEALCRENMEFERKRELMHGLCTAFQQFYRRETRPFSFMDLLKSRQFWDCHIDEFADYDRRKGQANRTFEALAGELEGQAREHLISVNTAWDGRDLGVLRYSFYLGYRYALSILELVAPLGDMQPMRNQLLLTEHQLGLTMTWEEREGEQDVRMRRSAVQAQQKQP